MSKNRKVVRLTENQLVNLIRTMVNKTVKSEEKKWVLESKRKLAAKLNESDFGMPQELSYESDPEVSTYEVEFWFYDRDAYDYGIIEVQANSEEEAIHKSKTEGGKAIVNGFNKAPMRAKKFKAIKIY